MRGSLLERGRERIFIKKKKKSVRNDIKVKQMIKNYKKKKKKKKIVRKYLYLKVYNFVEWEI